MRFNCEFAVKYLLPAFRSLVSKQLIQKYNLTQKQVADTLGLSQVAVSNYINSIRAAKCKEILEGDFLPVYSLACDSADKLALGQTSLKIVQKDFCELCQNLREKYVLNYVI